MTYASNLGTNKANVEKKVNYTGESNVYFVNTSSVKVANPSMPITADVVSKGDDVTKYLQSTKAGQNGKLDSAAINSTAYTAFKNVDISEVEIVSATSATNDSKLLYMDGVISATNDAYILDTETNSVIRVQKGQDLSEYMSISDDKSSASMKEQYRMLDEVVTDDASTTALNGTSGNLGQTTFGHKLQGTAVKTADIQTKNEFKLAEEAKKLYDADGKEVSGVALNKYFDENGQYTGGLYSDSQATKAVLSDNDPNVDATKKGEDKIGSYITKNYADVTADLSFSLHVGADSDRTNKIQTNIQSMSSAALGVNKLSSKLVGIVDESGDNATDAIDVIAEALQKVSTQRSALGAVQNRLEHTIKNLDNVVENTTSAESAIRDTDMATEMVKYSNANILSQAGQSMLAQANQSNQGVLSILG